MTFLVLVEGDAGGWRVDREALSEAICARWAAVEIDSTHHSEVQSFRWEFETENGPGEAYLHKDGTCLYMDVWQDEAVGLAIAFRELPLQTLTWCSVMMATPSMSSCAPGLRRQGWPS
ncbi:hypothetical protein [Streptomyces sp. 3214.6]|uniref:hypothetical protein n=1 Tax=Streptomyces sp. 3214.6 TaxID=1882757 RepID=UPI00090C83D0|nr:hypothetical protein [Streptomyces sp. 3214.6]SHH62957.1 hypothetical protein SAMN05444521_1195 [Streptomyces sp. 3214.6]